MPAEPSQVIVGFREIAAALKCSERQVLQFATRRVDPLPLLSYQGVPRIQPADLAEWRRRHGGLRGTVRIRGWSQIALRVEMSRIAAIRASKLAEGPLPVKRSKGGGMVWAYASALDDWKAAHTLPYAAHRVLRTHDSWKRLRGTKDKRPEAKRRARDHGFDDKGGLVAAAE